jgi:hypothetical protein
VLPATDDAAALVGLESDPASDENKDCNTNADALHGCTNFMVGDIDDAASTDPFTHVYMYDLGFPPPLQQSIARKFNSSQHAQFLVSYRPPHRVIHEYAYDVELVDQCPTSMHGSGESHMCYFYRRLFSENMGTPARAGDIALPANYRAAKGVQVRPTQL